MGLKSNKKGLFFTFITVMLLLVILIAFLAKTGNQASSEIQQSQSKIKSLNAFVKSFDKIAERALYASAKQTIISSQQYSFDKRDYIRNFQTEFPHLIIDGEVKQNEILNNMSLFNISNTLKIIKYAALETNVNLTYKDPPEPTDILIQHTTPWEIEVTLNLQDIRIADLENEVLWNLETMPIKTTLFVRDFKDPFYMVEKGESVPIVKTTKEDFREYTIFKEFIDKKEFTSFEQGPSFLQRMAGDFSDSTNGIESIISYEEISSPNPVSESYVDYFYWQEPQGGNRNDGNDNCQIPGFEDYPNFLLDSYHKDLYTGTPC